MDDPPKTRRETKKDPRMKAGNKYSQKHVRIQTSLSKKN